MIYRNIRAMRQGTKNQIGCVSVLVDENEDFSRLERIVKAINYDDLFKQIKALGYECEYKEYHQGAQYKIIVK